MAYVVSLLITRRANSFPRIQIRQEMLQCVHFFDAVFEPGFALVRGHQAWQKDPGQWHESRTPWHDEAIFVSRARVRFAEDVLHADELDTSAHNLMDEPRLVYLLDRGNDLDFVARVSSQVLAQGDLRSGTARAVRRAANIASIDVIERMPDTVTIETPARDLDLAFGEVGKPPGKHAGRDAFEDLVLDPVLLASVGERLDSGLRRRRCLELPGDRQWLRKRRVHGRRPPSKREPSRV